MIYLAFGLGSARHHYRRGETIQNANEPAHLLNPEIPTGIIRPKRESFVDLNNIPSMMRGFATSLGRGLSNMVQHSQKIASQGHKFLDSGIHSMMHNMPTIIYGKWKPIPSKPSYPVHPEGSYMHPYDQPPPPSSYAAPEPYRPEPESYRPEPEPYRPEPEPYIPPATPEPYVPPYSQPTFQPIIKPAKPIYTIPEVFVKPEPIYVKPAPTPGPIYLKPFETEPEDIYGKPIGEPISYPAVPATPEYEYGFLLDPETPPSPTYPPPSPSPSPTYPPSPSPPPSYPPSPSPTYPTIVTNGHPTDIPVMSHGIPAEYSQNPEHISSIAGHTLWYKNTKKLVGHPHMVEGDLANYRPRPPGPSLRLLRSR